MTDYDVSLWVFLALNVIAIVLGYAWLHGHWDMAVRVIYMVSFAVLFIALGIVYLYIGVEATHWLIYELPTKIDELRGDG